MTNSGNTNIITLCIVRSLSGFGQFQITAVDMDELRAYVKSFRGRL